MKRILKKSKDDERGEIMLESAIILIPVIVMLMVLICLSFLFYQQALMTSIASEIAADTARNYKYPQLGMNVFGEFEFGDEVEIEDVNSAALFRMSLGMNRITSAHEARATEYARSRIGISSLGINPDNIVANCEIVKSGIGRAYVHVTVSQKADTFLSGFLDYAGITRNGGIFSGSAYAECNDLIEYTSLINFTQYEANQWGILNPFAKLYDAGSDLYKAIIGLFE